MKPLSCPSQFILWQQSVVKKSYPINALLGACCRLLLSTIALFPGPAQLSVTCVLQATESCAGPGNEVSLPLLENWRPRNSLHSVWPKKNLRLNPLQCKKFNSWNLWVNLTECWNYLICMRFIGISTVVRTLVSVPSTDNDPLKSVERYLFVSNKMWKVSNCEISCCTWQGVVIPIGAVVTAVTGVKKRSRGQGLFLASVKQSRTIFKLGNSSQNVNVKMLSIPRP